MESAGRSYSTRRSITKAGVGGLARHKRLIEPGRRPAEHVGFLGNTVSWVAHRASEHTVLDVCPKRQIQFVSLGRQTCRKVVLGENARLISAQAAQIVHRVAVANKRAVLHQGARVLKYGQYT